MKRLKVFCALISLLGGFTLAQAGGDKPIKVRQEIQLAKDAWGCLSKDNLDAALTHERHGKGQAKQQYFDDYRCVSVSVPEGQRFRIVSIEKSDVQFVNAENNDQQGLWTDARFIKQ